MAETKTDAQKQADAAAAEAAKKDAAAAEAAKKAAAEKPAKLVQGRVLMATGGHKADDVIALPADEAKAAEKAGWLDTDLAAVAYAKTLAAEAAAA